MTAHEARLGRAAAHEARLGRAAAHEARSERAGQPVGPLELARSALRRVDELSRLDPARQELPVPQLREEITRSYTAAQAYAVVAVAEAVDQLVGELRTYLAPEAAAVEECRVCGCTADAACPGGCWWANWEQDLCSVCAPLGQCVDCPRPAAGLWPPDGSPRAGAAVCRVHQPDHDQQQPDHDQQQPEQPEPAQQGDQPEGRERGECGFCGPYACEHVGGERR